MLAVALLATPAAAPAAQTSVIGTSTGTMRVVSNPHHVPISSANQVVLRIRSLARRRRDGTASFAGICPGTIRLVGHAGSRFVFVYHRARGAATARPATGSSSGASSIVRYRLKSLRLSTRLTPREMAAYRRKLG